MARLLDILNFINHVLIYNLLFAFDQLLGIEGTIEFGDNVCIHLLTYFW